MATAPGTIVVEHGDATTTTLRPVMVRPASIAYNASGFRAPYGTDWFNTGDKKRGPELFTFTHEAWNDAAEGIATAAEEELPDLLTLLTSAALIHTNLGYLVPVAAGFTAVATTPIEAGYRVDVTIAARTGRLASDASVLRFIDGSVWELR